MFSLKALLKFINTDNDKFVQKSEIQQFLKTQKSSSIFTDYLNSVQEQVDSNTFLDDMFNIMQKAREQNNQSPELDFADENAENKFQKIQEKEEIAEIKTEALSRFGTKVQNLDEFENLFNQFLHEAKERGESYDSVFIKFRNLTYSKPISMEMVRASKVHTVMLPDDFVFDDMDWSNSREVFHFLAFNDKTFSKTSKENLPQGFDPQKVFDNGKSIGLGIDDVHNMGYTGKGVSYAIIDSGTLDKDGNQHQDIKFKEYHVSEYADKKVDINHYHGRAVSYIAQEIAPDADCYYYAQQNGEGMDAPVLDNLKQILEKNKTLPEDKKIRFVSMSMPLYGGEESKKVVSELDKQGVWVFYSGCPEDDSKGYLNKKDPMGDPNDFNNYQIMTGGAAVIVTPDGKENKFVDPTGKTLFYNSGDRTVPDSSSDVAYRHDSRASQSWTVPVIAGYYTLACQADPSMTKEKFLALAEQTARVVDSPIPVYMAPSINASGEEMQYIGQSKDTVKIRIVDIKALLQAIEKG